MKDRRWAPSGLVWMAQAFRQEGKIKGKQERRGDTKVWRERFACDPCNRLGQLERVDLKNSQNGFEQGIGPIHPCNQVANATAPQRLCAGPPDPDGASAQRAFSACSRVRRPERWAMASA